MTKKVLLVGLDDELGEKIQRILPNSMTCIFVDRNVFSLDIVTNEAPDAAVFNLAAKTSFRGKGMRDFVDIINKVNFRHPIPAQVYVISNEYSLYDLAGMVGFPPETTIGVVIENNDIDLEIAVEIGRSLADYENNQKKKGGGK